MIMPDIPDFDYLTDIPRDKVLNLLLASIAFKELGLSHILNAEAEKIQSVLGTLDVQEANDTSVDDLLNIDRAVERILRDVIKEEMLLQFKLENILDFILTPTTTTTTATTTASTSSTWSTSTSTTSTTTTSTTSTTTTTTNSTTCKGCCVPGSGSGVIPPGADIRFVGGRANIQDSYICSACCGTPGTPKLSYQAVRSLPLFGTNRYTLVARLNTLQIQRPDPFNPNPDNVDPNVMEIRGLADAEFDSSQGDTVSGVVSFTYTFTYAGTGQNSNDTFSLQATSDTAPPQTALNHESGVISLD